MPYGRSCPICLLRRKTALRRHVYLNCCVSNGRLDRVDNLYFRIEGSQIWFSLTNATKQQYCRNSKDNAANNRDYYVQDSEIRATIISVCNIGTWWEDGDAGYRCKSCNHASNQLFWFLWQTAPPPQAARSTANASLSMYSLSIVSTELAAEEPETWRVKVTDTARLPT